MLSAEQLLLQEQHLLQLLENLKVEEGCRWGSCSSYCCVCRGRALRSVGWGGGADAVVRLGR